MVNQYYQPRKTCIKPALPPYCLMTCKTASQEKDAVALPFIMLRHGNATNPGACVYYPEDLSVKETIDKRTNLGQSNDRIYVDLASKEKSSLSETMRDPVKKRIKMELMLTKTPIQSA